MAGLVAAYELKRQGHDPVVLEAQNRVGGRIYTLRVVRARACTPRPARCAFRASHDLTLEYCRLFDLPMRPFVMGNPKGLVYVGGERMTAAEANEHPERLPFNLTPTEHGRIGRLAVERRDRRPARRWSRTKATQAWPEIVRQLRRVLALRVPEVARLLARARSSSTRS